jgi:hypothetical protein
MMKNNQMIIVALVTVALLAIIVTMKDTSVQATDKKGNACKSGIVASQAEITGLPI